VPYLPGFDRKAEADMKNQAHMIATDIVANTTKGALQGVSKEAKIKELENKKLIALIAYLQRLGTDVKKGKNIK
jgi:cytochrome c oxidase cbb3-type subunit I/II